MLPDLSRVANDFDASRVECLQAGLAGLSGEAGFADRRSGAATSFEVVPTVTLWSSLRRFLVHARRHNDGR